jgi:hypothetical protein
VRGPLNKTALFSASIVLLALLIAPVPFLPPDSLVKLVQAVSGMGWSVDYLVSALALQSLFYGLLGALAGTAITPAPTVRGRLLQIGIAPLIIVGVSFLVRAIRAGHLPVWVNAVIPVVCCLIGVIAGVALVHRRWKAIVTIATLVFGVALGGILGRSSSALSMDTKARLQKLVSAGPDRPRGDAFFGASLQTIFAPVSPSRGSMVEENESAILAWGIALGDHRLARFVGLDPDSELVRRATEISQGTTLRGREDWARHYAVSAALAVLAHPWVGDAGGLMKEEADALSQGSGFSFGDLAADRAGVRFAEASTSSETSAKTMQRLLQDQLNLDELFPKIVDLPENLTVQEFRQKFGTVGSERYRQEIIRIEAALDGCEALSVSGSGH